MTKGTPPRMWKGTLTGLSLLLVAVAPLLTTPVALTSPAQTKVVRGEWASVTHDAALADEIKAETLAADPLEQASDKPDGVYPAHLAFTLVGLRPPPSQPAVEPVLRVSPVADYKRAYAVSPRYVRDTERTVRELRELLRRQPAQLPRDIPTLPFPDATAAFHAHVRYLRFRGGRGVAYLTQSQQDEGLINNQSMTYEFRGLTDDGRYYVTAALPVARPTRRPPTATRSRRASTAETPRGSVALITPTSPASACVSNNSRPTVSSRACAFTTPSSARSTQPSDRPRAVAHEEAA